MFKYSNIARNYLKAIKKSNLLFPQAQSGWIDSSRFYASDFKKRGGPVDGIAQRKTTNSLNTIKSTNAPLSVPNSCPPKIVQVRAKGTSNEETPPPSSHTVTEPPGHSRQKPPITPPPQNNSNTLRNTLIGLIIAAASLGGVYYSGILDSGSQRIDYLEEDKKNKKGKSRPIVRNPKLKDDFPSKVPYLLIGGGTASFAAFRAIKSKDPKAKVLVISAEDSLPYMRPPLSKEIWQQKEIPQPDKLSFKQWNGQERSLFYEPSDFYMDIHELEEAPNGGVTVATGWVASRIDANANTVEIEDPHTNSTFTIQYDKCLIATGSRPKNLPVFEQASAAVSSKTVLYRNVRDLENLWHRIQGATSVAIIGGGFLGSELACSLARRNNGSAVKVYQMFKESGNMGRVLPEYLAQWTTDRVIEEGVDVIPSVEVLEANSIGNQVLLTLSNGTSVKADVVVVAVGSEPCTQLAETSSLEVDPVVGGFLVNAELEARSNLYAAGDAACFYDPALGRRRVEHHDHAVVSGRLAGENMAGSAKPYKHQSMFWSDLGRDVGYEAIGVIDSCLPTVAVFSKNAAEKSDKTSDASSLAESVEGESANHSAVKNHDLEKPNDQQEAKPVKVEFEGKQAVVKKDIDSDPNQNYNKGIIFYLKKDMVVGIVLWNVFNRMHIARQVLAERRKYDDLNEVAKLFNLHDD